jgi:DNA-binding response OmpR family regulator
MNVSAKILLIDDDAALLLAVGDQLKLEGYEVTLAQSGEQALQLLRTLAPDLIILDISMPGMTGLAFLKKISGPDSRPRYPVLIFTARANMEKFFTSTTVEGFLAKTSDPSRLLDEVQRIILKYRKPSRTEPDEKLHRRRILIVENDPKLNIRLSCGFSAAGYDTVSLTEPAKLLETIHAKHPDIILIKELLPGGTGSSIAASLASFTTASGISIVLYDGSGMHKADTKFPNVARFVTTETPPDLLKAVAAVQG